MKNLIILVLTVALYLQGCNDPNSTSSLPQTEAAAMVAESASDDSVVKKCMDDVDLAAFKNVQRTECYVKEVARLEAILELTINDVIKKSPSDSRQYLQEAEEAWTNSRNTWCNYVGSLPLAPLPIFNRQYCLAEETNKHIEQLIRAKAELNDINN